MDMWITGRSRIVAAAIAVLTGAALLVQFALNVAERGGDTAAELVRFYGWFTIWTNTAVAIVAGHVALVGRARGPAHPAMFAATMVRIAVFDLVYNTLLTILWDRRRAARLLSRG